MPGLLGHPVQAALLGHVASIADAIRAEMCLCHADTYARFAAGGTPHEPDFVATLVHRLPNRIVNATTPNLPSSLTMQVIGIFIHQSPMATFLGSRCELGDMLIAARAMKPQGSDGVATLVQVKKASSANRATIASLAGAPQYQLYDQWPPFVVSAWNPNAIGLPCTPEQGVLGIVNAAPCALPVSQPPLYAHWGWEDFRAKYVVKDLASSWAEVIAFAGGQDFLLPATNAPKGFDDWSYVIQQLLLHTAQLTYNRRPSGRVNAPRANIVTMATSMPYFLTFQGDVLDDIDFYGDGEPPKRGTYELGPDDGGGFGMILVEFFSSEWSAEPSDDRWRRRDLPRG